MRENPDFLRAARKLHPDESKIDLLFTMPGVITRRTPEDVSIDIISTMPYRKEYGQEELQGYLDEFGSFHDLSYQAYFGIQTFTALLIENVFKLRGPDTTIILNLPGQGPVHVPEHYFSALSNGQESWLTHKDEELNRYYRSKLLIGEFGRYHSTGTLILNGNVGSYFAWEASGGKIILNGECGNEPCHGLMGAAVVINGIAGHHTLDDARSGVVEVNDGVVDGQQVSAMIRSFVDNDNRNKAQCYINGKRVYPISNKDNFHIAMPLKTPKE
jgi:hypothetical protein